MSLVGVEVENGGVLLKFLETAAENGGARHLQEARYPARSPRPPYHCHPKQDERFTILEGQLRFHVDGKDRDVKAGDAIDVERGAFHYAQNLGDVPVLAHWETRPAMRTAEFFVTMARAMKGKPRPPLVDAIAILGEYRDHFQLARPPLLVQRVMFACLAPFGRAALR